MRFGRIVDAVVELGHRARATRQVANQSAKPPKAAALFRNRHGEQRLALFAHFGPLGDKTQAVKVHVGAAQNRGVGFAFCFVCGNVFFDGGHRQGACGLDDAAGVYKHVFDGGANGIGIDGHEFVHQLAADAKGFFADQLDGGAIGKQTHIAQRDTFFGADRLHHGVGIVHLHANDLDLGPHGLDVVGHTRDQAAAADGDKHRIKSP